MQGDSSSASVRTGQSCSWEPGARGRAAHAPLPVVGQSPDLGHRWRVQSSGSSAPWMMRFCAVPVPESKDTAATGTTGDKSHCSDSCSPSPREERQWWGLWWLLAEFSANEGGWCEVAQAANIRASDGLAGVLLLLFPMGSSFSMGIPLGAELL